MFCSGCGVSLTSNARFCPNCGAGVTPTGSVPVGAEQSGRDSAPPTGGAGARSNNIVGALIGHMIDGKYRLDGIIGAGGMGTVYRATRLMIGDAVAILYLGKSEVEYRGKQITTENFKVLYAQAQIIGVQLKKSVAVYLATKIVDAHGKKQEFNFFSFDKELSQTGRPYLEMIQQLLRAH